MEQGSHRVLVAVPAALYKAAPLLPNRGESLQIYTFHFLQSRIIFCIGTDYRYHSYVGRYRCGTVL